MRRRTYAVTAAILLLSIGAPSLQASDLWDRAVAQYADLGDLIPGRMVIRFDQYNGRGSLVSSETSELEISVGPDGEILSRIVRATRNGEDVTEQRRENPSGGSPFGGSNGSDGDQENDNSPFAGLQKSPFDPDEQHAVSVTDTGRTETVDGIRARVFEFQQLTGNTARTSGTAWISEETGSPVMLTASVEPLPGYVESFEMIQRFAGGGSGRWYMTAMEFSGEGRILFLRRRLESEFLFSEYFPAAGEQVD